MKDDLKCKQYSCEESLNFSIFRSRSQRILINNIGNYQGYQLDIFFVPSLQFPLIPPVRWVLSITIYHSSTASAVPHLFITTTTYFTLSTYFLDPYLWFSMDARRKTHEDQNPTDIYPIDLNILNCLRDSKAFCDVTIVIENQEFSAHKVSQK